MFQEFLMKKMLRKQGLNDAQITQLMEAVKKNPDLFKKMAEDIQAKVKGGMSQQQAAMAVMQANQNELKGLF